VAVVDGAGAAVVAVVGGTDVVVDGGTDVVVVVAVVATTGSACGIAGSL
jgi:hypothetical protein